MAGLRRWEAAANEARGHPFLVEADGREVSYAEAARRVHRRAQTLAPLRTSCTTSAEQFVGLVAESREDDIWSAMALLAMGRPFLMLHPAFPPAERRAIAARYTLSTIIEGVPAPAGGPSHGSEPGEPERSEPMVAFVTSGSTGIPKAVVHTWTTLVASARASEENLGWQPNDRWLLSIPIAHVGGFSVLVRCLVARRTVVLARSPGPDAFTDAVEQRGVTLASLVPTQLVRLLEQRPSWRPPASLRAILLGGAPAAADLVARATDAGYPILKTYGLTEAGSQIATERYRGCPSSPEAVGPPLAGVRLKVVDGRILIRGPMMMRGFLRTTGEELQPDGWYDTGDRGRLTARGELVVYGRGAEMIVSGGENVYPAEVEAALLNLDAVQEALVWGVEDPEWGQAVAAAVVFAPGRPMTWSVIRQQLSERLASFKCPRRWVELEAFDRLASGKVDRPAVRQAARLRLAQATRSTLTGGNDDHERSPNPDQER